MVFVQKRLNGASDKADFWHGENIEHVEKKSSKYCLRLRPHSMLSSTVIGVELHRLGLKFNLTKIELEWSCTR